MRRVLGNSYEVFRIYQSGFSADSTQANVEKEIKMEIKEEESSLDFSQMFNTEMKKLSLV